MDAPSVTNYLTIDKLSAHSGLSVPTLRRYVRKGLLVAFQPGGPGCRLLFRPDALEQAGLLLMQKSTAAMNDTPNQPRRLPGRRPGWLVDRSDP
jgi:hypothetical protein